MDHPCDPSGMTSQKREDIQNFIDKTENVDLVLIDQYITDTDTQLKDNVSHFEKLSQQIKLQTNKLKEFLDHLTAQTLSLYQQMEEDNTKLLQTYKQDLEMYSAQLKQQVQECKIALQRGSHIQIDGAGCEIQSPLAFPVKPTLVTASFTPNQNPQGHIAQALGEVSTSGKGLYPVHLDGGWSVLSSKEPEPYPGQQRRKGRKEVASPVYTLLSKTKVLQRWSPSSNITSICCTTDGQVWTSSHLSDTFTLYDRKGKVIQEVKHTSGVIDISMSPTTNTLWICDWTNSIAELVSGRLVHRFSTRDLPQCICVTASNHVIVGMVNNISKFTSEGRLVLSTPATSSGKQFLSTPYKISECPVTQNVTVADWDDGDGGELKTRVLVIDTDFKELFVYDGGIPSTYQPTSQSGGKPFYLQGVVYDSVGNLVIGDRDNNRILLISGRGEFIRVLHTDDIKIRNVCVDKEDVLFALVGYQVKILQYTRTTLDKPKCIIS